jgi:hypothetical protein
MVMRADEEEPLLPKSAEKDGDSSTKPSFATSFAASVKNHASKLHAPAFACEKSGKLVTYDHHQLLTVKAFAHMGSSVLTHWPIWCCLIYVAVIAILCATMMFWLPSAKSFDTDRFRVFCTFLKVFISFMVGIYVQHSFMRWWSTVMCFEDFLISIKQLLFFMHSIPTTKESIALVERFSIASAFLMSTELAAAEHMSAEKEYSNMSCMLEDLVSRKLLENVEIEVLLAKTQTGHMQVSRTVWSWIAEILSTVSKADGSALIPPMFIRVLTLAQTSIGKIEHLKRNVTVQTPFSYAQLLAMLVHLYITLLAIFGGLVLGSAWNEVVSRGAEMHEAGATRPSGSALRDFYGALQVCGGQMIVMLVEPMLYIGFLDIAHMLCYPFGRDRHNLPTDTFIERLHAEVSMMAVSRSFYREKLARIKGAPIEPRAEAVWNKEDDRPEEDEDAD